MTVILSLLSFEAFATDTKTDDSIEQLIKTYNVGTFELKEQQKPIPPYILIDNPASAKKEAVKQPVSKPTKTSLPKKEFKMTNVKDGKFVGYGTASWYGKPFHGRKTASGERYNMYAMTAAHNKLPFGTKVKVTCMTTGKSVVVRVNDTGAFGKKYNRAIDLSYAAAKALDMVDRGITKVKLEVVS